MARVLSWLVGLGVGTAVGAVLIMIFVPTPSQEIRARLVAGYEEALEAARTASEERRAELEAELNQMRCRSAGELPANTRK